MNSNSNASTVLANAIVVASLIEVWSGKITVSRDEDLDTSARTNLPPHAIYSDGQKQIISPKVLAKLETQRRMAQRDMVALGFKSPLGYIITPDREQELYDKLNDRRDEFEAAKQDIIHNLDRYYAEWEAENPGHEAFLRRKRPVAAEVAARCKFDFAVFRVAAVDSEVGRERFDAVAAATVPALVKDIATNASNILKASFATKARVTQRQMSAVRDLVAKLKGFTMFDPRILPSAQALEQMLGKLPHTGPLDPADTTLVASMLRTLSDPNEVLAIGERHLSTTDDGDDETDAEVIEAPVAIGVQVPGPPRTTPTPATPPRPNSAPVVF